MEKFRKEVKTRLVLIRVFFVVVMAVLLNQQFGFVSLPVTGNEYIEGFQMGLILGMELSLLVLTVKYQWALKNERQLEDLYNKSHDERTILIRQKAGLPATWVIGVALVFAAVIAGYYNMTVFYTLLAVAFVQFAVSGTLKVLYSRKY